MTVTINVTDQDIVNGVPDACGQCPVALAVKRAIPQATQVNVSGVMADGQILIHLPDVGAKIAELPAKAAQWINDFDRSRAGDPFSFDVLFMTFKL